MDGQNRDGTTPPNINAEIIANDNQNQIDNQNQSNGNPNFVGFSDEERYKQNGFSN